MKINQYLVKIHFHTNEPWKILEYCNSVWIDLRQRENKDKDDEDCNSFYLENESGVGNITLYQVFPGIELVYNDMHLAYCSKGFHRCKNRNFHRRNPEDRGRESGRCRTAYERPYRFLSGTVSGNP